MSARTNPIALNDEEKQRLDEVAEEAFGTTELPYGAVVSMLIEQYNESSMEDN